MITDDTLREGLQASGLSFKRNEKLEMAKLLSESGIDSALISYPSAHISEVEITRKIVDLRFFKETYALGRTLISDIDKIADTGANISLHLPFRIDDLTLILDSIRYASKKGKKLEVAVVDVMKYEEEKLIKLCEGIVSAGADALQLPDTTGTAIPEKYGNIVSSVRKKLKDVELEIHCHNDSGMSLANSIAGLEAGADRVDTTVYGIGERNGITDQLSLLHYLNSRGYQTKISGEKLRKVYDHLLNLILQKVGPEFFIENFPVVGRNVATHTAGTHAAFSDTFSGLNFSFNVYTGRSMLRKLLESRSIYITEEELSRIVERIKDESVEEGRSLKADDILKMVG